MEPTIDTEAPTDTPAEEPGEIVVEGAELNAEGDSYTVTIADYASLKNRVSIAATLDGKETKIPSNGQIVGTEGADGKKPAIGLTLTAKEGYQIKKVMNGETEVSGDGTYTISNLTADSTITVTTAAVYTLSVGNLCDPATTYGIKVKIGEGENVSEKAVADKAEAVFEKGALEFTVDGYTADANGGDRLKVYYVADGSSDDDTTEIVGEEKTEGEGESAAKKTVYTVSADVINSLDASIKIILEKEEKTAVTVTANDKVDVQYWGKKTEGETTTETWVGSDDATAIKSAFVGDTFKFKAVAKADYAISKVKVGDDELTLAENGEYSVEVTKDMGAISFETVLASTASRTLTFTLTGDKGSATAKITSVTPADTTTEGEEDTSRAATATTDETEMANALGITTADLTLESGKALSVLASATAIEVTVKPDTDGGYELVKTGADETLESDGSRKVTFEGTTLTDAITIAASTQEVALAGENSVYFKPSIKKNGDADNQFLTNLTVATNENVIAQTGENAGTYEIKPGVRTVSFTVTAKEGYKVKEPAEGSSTPIKSITPGAPAANGDVVYTVTLFAKKIEGTTAAPTTLEIEEDAIKVTAAVETAEGSEDAEYTAALQAKGIAEGDEYESYTAGDELAFGSGLKATITPADGCQLDEVSYVMGEADAVTIPVAEDFDEEGESLGFKAELEITKMTGDVKITVKSSKSLTLSALTDSDGNEIDSDEDGIYAVEYGKKYLVGATRGGTDVSARDISVVVKDASGAAVAMTNPIISGKRSINLANKNLAGQEITADVSYKGQAVGTYIMSVEKKTTAITVNGGNAIAQSVDSTKEYDFTTDGDLGNVKVDVESTDAAFRRLISASINEKGKLEVTVGSAKREDVAEKKTTGTGDEAVTTWESKKATIKVSAKDVDDVEASVDITATPLFDEDAAPTVSLVDAADTVLNVNVSMDSVAAPKTGSVWYEVTATAKANTPAQGDTPASNKPDNMLASVTETVKATGGSRRVALQVADSENLGEGAEWGYEVTAKLIYKEGKQSNSTTVVESKPSEKLETATKTPLFEDALKLKKAKGAPAKLFTGQSGEIVIAEPQWTKKFSSYKILSGNISDNMYGLEFDVNADGNIVVTDVYEDATLGKHTITVVATADQTTNHTMYASRATINVNVVKGINELDVVSPSTSIYKDPKKAATLKTTVEYNNESWNWNGKKDVNAPAAKKVNWSIVDANSTTRNIIEAPAYLQVGNTKSGVSIKNGTVTVAKAFTTDPRHANNNRFKVLAEAADFDGNTTKALSDVITITTDALDISTLVLVHENDNSELVVTAVHDITDKKPVSVLASDVDYGYLYALPEDAAVTVGMKGSALMRQLKNAVPVDSLTMTSTGKKVLRVGPDKDNEELYPNQLEVLAAGKKAGVKVVTNDGGKKTHTMTMTLDYKATAGSDLALGIEVRDDVNFSGATTTVFAPTGANVAKANKANVKETPVEAEFTTTGAARLEVELYVGNKADATSTSYTRPEDIWSTNYKLAVKGGKAISNGLGRAVIITTAKETTLTLTDLSKEAKDAKKKPYVYKLVNKAYDNTALAKAPKVKVVNALHQFGDKKEQTVVMNVLDAANKNAFFAAGTTVKVEIDWSARNDKNAWMLNYLSNALSENNNNSQVFAFADTNGNVNLDLHNIANHNGYTYDYDAGSYKVKVTAGTGTGASFKAKTLPATTTIKVTKDKAFTFKPTTSYTINKVDGGAVLTGKSNANVKAGELTYMNFENLQNANLKGTSNKFTHYFKIAEDPLTKTQRLTLNTDDDLVKAMLYEKKADGTVDTTKPIADPVITIPKEDLTGYITYEAGPSVSYYTNSEYGVRGTVKITVKIAPEAKPGKAAKPSQKYGANLAEVALTANSTTEMNVVTNGSYVSVAYAMVDTDKKGNAEQLNVDLAGNAKGQIVVKTTGAVEEGKTYTTNLLIVPNSSFYKGLIDKAPVAAVAKEGEAAPAETKQDLIKKYGIAMKVGVLASKTPVKTPDPTAVVGPDEPDDPTPPAPAEKTPADAVEVLGKVQTWKGSDDQEIKATIKDNALENVLTTETALVTAVQAYLDKQDGYTGFTVAKKSESNLTLQNDNKTAKVTLTVTKGEASAEIEITINAEAASEGSGEGNGGGNESGSGTE